MGEYAIYDGSAHQINAGAGMVALSDGWDSGWLAPPEITGTNVNGQSDVIALIANVLDISVNKFDCVVSGAYVVNVYTAVGGTLISTQSVAIGVQANITVNYSDCTHHYDSVTRQAYIEIVPQSGQVLTVPRFNTSSQMIVACIASLPNATTITNMFYAVYAIGYCMITTAPLVASIANAFYRTGLRFLSLPTLPECTTISGVLQYVASIVHLKIGSTPKATSIANSWHTNQALQSIDAGGLALVTVLSGAFGTTVATSCSSLRRLTLSGLTRGFTLTYTSMQATELNALFTSLGAASGAQTIDVRNNPGSATCDTSIATAKGYTVLTA